MARIYRMKKGRGFDAFFAVKRKSGEEIFNVMAWQVRERVSLRSRVVFQGVLTNIGY